MTTLYSIRMIDDRWSVCRERDDNGRWSRQPFVVYTASDRADAEAAKARMKAAR